MKNNLKKISAAQLKRELSERKTKQVNLKTASIIQLERELKERKLIKISSLTRQREVLDKEILELGGTVVTDQVVPTTKVIARKAVKTVARGRNGNGKSLPEMLVEIAADGQSRNADAFIKILQTRGWKTSSAQPYYVVAAALASQEKKKVFERVQKGIYKLSKKG